MTEHWYRPCTAEIHEEGCKGYATTIDHLTPKCIAKELGWTDREINQKNNKQPLSEECHTAKDKSTPARLELLRQQLRGEYIKLGEHQKVDTREFQIRVDKFNSLGCRPSKKR